MPTRTAPTGIRPSDYCSRRYPPPPQSFTPISRPSTGASVRGPGRSSRPDLDSSFDDFVAGPATTDHDAVTIISVERDTVHIRLSARQPDGIYRAFAGYYVVRGGAIVSASSHVACDSSRIVMVAAVQLSSAPGRVAI